MLSISVNVFMFIRIRVAKRDLVTRVVDEPGQRAGTKNTNHKQTCCRHNAYNELIIFLPYTSVGGNFFAKASFNARIVDKWHLELTKDASSNMSQMQNSRMWKACLSVVWSCFCWCLLIRSSQKWCTKEVLEADTRIPFTAPAAVEPLLHNVPDSIDGFWIILYVYYV